MDKKGAERDRNQRDGKKPVTYYDYGIFNGKVKLVGDDGKISVMERDDAILLAKTKGMNLVQVAYNKNDYPRSVCKITDFSKFKYEQKKREKDLRRKQRESVSELKEIKFSIRIDDGDENTKISKIREILDDGDKVKISIRLIRREMQRKDFAKDPMCSILSELEGAIDIDQLPSFAGNIFSCVVRKRKQ